MRIVISAPRKSGGAQLRCLLSIAYGLTASAVPAPQPDDGAALVRWLADLPEKCVGTCDLPYGALAGPAADSNVQVVGVIRHPFDLFVSNFDVAQQRATRGREEGAEGRPWSVLAGEELDGETALHYAVTGFSSEVTAFEDWLQTGAAVRYEDLLADPAGVLTSLSSQLGTRTPEHIAHAVSLCPPENIVVSRPGRGRRMPSLPPGAWRERVPANLLEVLRATYGADVLSLGYDAF